MWCSSWASTLLAGRQLIGLPDGGPLSSSSGMAGRLMAIIPASGSLLPRTLVSQLSVGEGMEAEESKVTPNPEVLLGGCTSC